MDSKTHTPVSTSMDRLGKDFDRNNGITILNKNRAHNLAAGLAGQKTKYLQHPIYSPKTNVKLFPICRWVHDAKCDVREERENNILVDRFKSMLS